jgi:cell division protein FtsL
MRLSGLTLTALAIATLLAALSLVTWRQTRSLDALAELERIEREISLVEAERGELERRIQSLESRGRVVPAAREMLGMHTPSASEIILLPGETR